MEGYDLRTDDKDDQDDEEEKKEVSEGGVINCGDLSLNGYHKYGGDCGNKISWPKQWDGGGDDQKNVEDNIHDGEDDWNDKGKARIDYDDACESTRNTSEGVSDHGSH